ncbi:Ig-like domain-containing protein [Desulfonema magnum]|nr:S8 family serine peptidase [Desulfonema magnum]
MTRASFICLFLLLFFVIFAHRTTDAKTNPAPDMNQEETEFELYIIRLTDPPVAAYQGSISGLSATTPRKTGKKRLDIRSSASKTYRKYLSDKQNEIMASMEQTIGRSFEPIYTYDVTYNGMAVRLTPEEAARIAKLPGVISVQQDRPVHLMTDVSPAFVNATEIWDGNGTNGLPETKGEGIIVGIIDTGIWPEHPSFADDGTFPRPPSKWGGKCTPPADGTKGYKCNNKLIGIQYFLDGYLARNEDEYDGLFLSGRDDVGHGTHTASVAAGNENVSADIYGTDRGLISGMAPRAHIASYKVFAPGGATEADSVAAIDKAVADGVDVINYSAGSSLAFDPWRDPDALSLLAACEAGVFVAVSAGNTGPKAYSVDSPANAPWVTSVGASYFNRLYLSDIEIQISEPESGSDQGIEIRNYYGATTTRGISNFNLVHAEGIADVEEDTSGACLHPFPTGTFRSTDAVLCPKGNIDTATKGNFVQDGGAGAIIIYNDENNYDFNSYSWPVPAVLISKEAGSEIRELLIHSASSEAADNENPPDPGSRARTPNPITISFTRGESVYVPDPRIPANTVAGFSARGPNINELSNEPINVIKPDITAPGVHILAGVSPEYMIKINGVLGRFGHQGELFQVMQGTSMSSPHVAGLGALLKSLHPEWTPAQIQSALKTTAVSENYKARGEDGDEPATPFDLGAGCVDVSRAARAGFVLDETGDNFRAIDENDGEDASTLNLPGLTYADCLGECSWSRTLQSAMDVSVDWTVSAEGPGAANLTVSPTQFTLRPGGTQTIDIKAECKTTSGCPYGEWVFSEIRFIPELETRNLKLETRNSKLEDTDQESEFQVSSFKFQISPAHFPVAFRPLGGISPVESLEIKTRRNQGVYTLEGLKAISTDSLTGNVWFGEPEQITASLPEDSAHDEVYDDLNDGVFIKKIEVPDSARRFIVEIISSTASDLDLYVGIDDNGDGLPNAAEQRSKSSGNSWKEDCVFPNSGEPLEPGTYWVLVQNWKGSGNPEDEFTLAITVVDSKLETGTWKPDISVPDQVFFNEPFDVGISWDAPDLEPGSTQEGWIEIGTDHQNSANIVSMPFTFSRLANDVTISSDVILVSSSDLNGELQSPVHPGDRIYFTLKIQPDTIQGTPLVYTLVNTIPAGMTYVPWSATREPDAVSGNQITWTVETDKRGRTIEISYEVTVDEDLLLSGDNISPPVTLVNTVEHSVNGGPQALAKASVEITEQPVIIINSGEVSLPIPDENAKGVGSKLEISKKVILTDVNVRLNIRHPYVEDISACLISPSGTKITLFENLTGTRANFRNTKLDDNAEISIHNADAPFTGTFRPTDSLDVFRGEPVNGRWKLKVYDDRAYDEGILVSWGLEIRFESPEPVANEDTAVTSWDEPVFINVLENDNDPDNDPLRLIRVAAPLYGTAEIYDNETVIYTPEPEFIGEDQFIYTITDDNDGTAQTSVFVTVEKKGESFVVTTLEDVTDEDEELSLREAVLAAHTNLSVDGSPEGGFRDTITLPPGVLELGEEGHLDIACHLNIIGDPEAGTILETSGSERVFYVHEGAEVKIENLTICNSGTLTSDNFFYVYDSSDWWEYPFIIETGSWEFGSLYSVNGGSGHEYISDRDAENRKNISPRSDRYIEPEPEAWPWMAALVYRELDASDGQFCGGTLIHPEWVLTSAQCAGARGEGLEARGIDVVLGAQNLREHEGERMKVDEVIIHPNYDADTMDSDIGLLHLSEPSSQTYAEVIAQGDPSKMAEPGTIGAVIGWGNANGSSENYPEALFQVSVPILSNEEGSRHYENLPEYNPITENMLVAGYEGVAEDSCTGDMGSPLMVSPESAVLSSQFSILNSPIQAGIVSQRERCALAGYYGIYTRVSRFGVWIDEQIGGYPLPSGLEGGAILNKGTLTVIGTTLTGNSAVKGGAIYNAGVLTLMNSTVSGNSANLGGGLCNEGKARIIFSTIAENEARKGGGIFNVEAARAKGQGAREEDSTESLTVENTLIACNTAILEGPDVRGSVISHGVNLIGDSAGTSGWQDSDLSDTDPLLVPLMDNGGPTLTHAIQANGPASDAADSEVPEDKILTTDQRGEPRVSMYDIGAYEYDGKAYPPVALNDVAVTTENTSVIIKLLANDRDANGDDLIIEEIFSEFAYGDIKMKGKKKVIYTPSEDFIGRDWFFYTVSDGKSLSDAFVEVTVNPDMLPVTQDDEALTIGNTSVIIEVLANDKDPEGNPLTVADVAEPENGVAVTDGVTVTYTPNSDFIGTDRFMYRVSDGSKTGKAFITVTVEEAADPEPDSGTDSERYHSADYDPADYKIGFSELLRVIQLYTNGSYCCGVPGIADGYALCSDSQVPDAELYNCAPHDSDYSPQDWRIDMNELLRMIQFYNVSGYHADDRGEDGFIPEK